MNQNLEHIPTYLTTQQPYDKTSTPPQNSPTIKIAVTVNTEGQTNRKIVAATTDEQAAIKAVADWVRDQPAEWSHEATFPENTAGIEQIKNSRRSYENQIVDVDLIPDDTLIDTYFDFWYPEQNYTIEKNPTTTPKHTKNQQKISSVAKT